MTEPTGEFPKRCGCGATYDASTWPALPLCGYAGAYLSGAERRVVEMRHCTCLSTLAIEVDQP